MGQFILACQVIDETVKRFCVRKSSITAVEAETYGTDTDPWINVWVGTQRYHVENMTFDKMMYDLWPV